MANGYCSANWTLIRHVNTLAFFWLQLYIVINKSDSSGKKRGWFILSLGFVGKNDRELMMSDPSSVQVVTQLMELFTLRLKFVSQSHFFVMQISLIVIPRQDLGSMHFLHDRELFTPQQHSRYLSKTYRKGTHIRLVILSTSNTRKYSQTKLLETSVSCMSVALINKHVTIFMNITEAE